MTKIKSFLQHDLVYLIPLGIWVFFSMFRITLLFPYVDPYYVPISLACMLPIVLHELAYLPEYKKGDYIGAIIALFLFATAFLMKEGTVMYSVLCIFAARHTSLKRVLIPILIASTCGLVLTILCSQIGIVENYFAYDYGRSRYYLGFVYALNPPAIYMNVVAIYLYLRNSNISLLEILTLAIWGIVFYFITDSRLNTAMTLFMLICGYFLKYANGWLKKHTVLKYILSLTVIVSAFFAIAVTSQFDENNVLLVSIDNKIGHRIYFGKQSMDEHGIHLLPNDFEMHGHGLTNYGEKEEGVEYNYVDSFYIQYLLRYGVIFYMAILLLSTRALLLAAKNDDVYFLVIFSLFAINAIMMDMFFTLFYNAFLSFLSFITIRDEKDKFRLEANVDRH